jgi:hypothetical protein
MNWKEQLNQKEIELNLKKEETNVVPVKSISSVSSGSDSGRGSRIHLQVSNRKEINQINKKEEKLMIPSKGLFDDYNAIDKESIDAAEKVWKMIPKLIKIILNCRTNTVKIMDKLGIPREELPKKEVKQEEVK